MHYVNAQFDSFYNVWSRQVWMDGHVDGVPRAMKELGGELSKVVYFFMWPVLFVPLLALPWLVRDRRIRLLLIQCTICFFGFLLVPWFQPHYAAPMMAGMFAIVLQGMRHLRRGRVAQRPVGIGLSRVVVLSAITLAPFHPHGQVARTPSARRNRKPHDIYGP